MSIMSAGGNRLIGKLTLTVHKGRDLVNKQTLGKQDPYMVIVVGDEELRTKVHDGGGQAPVWEQSFIFNLDAQDPASPDVHMKIWDEELRTKVHDGGGQAPVWEQSFIFNLDAQDPASPDVHMKIWDKELLVDRMIGRADIPVIEMIKNKGPQWYTFVDKDNFKKVAGYVCITASYEGQGAPTPRTPTMESRNINYNENRAPSPAFGAVPAPQQQPPVMIQQPQVVYQQPAAYFVPAPQQVYVPPPAQAPSHAPAPHHAPVVQPHAPASGQSEWACKACTYWNKPTLSKCEMCETARSH